MFAVNIFVPEFYFNFVHREYDKNNCLLKVILTVVPIRTG